VGVVFTSPLGNIYHFSFRLEFYCTNNMAEYEALLLGLE
jgi:ribonuclease HI